LIDEVVSNQVDGDGPSDSIGIGERGDGDTNHFTAVIEDRSA
jgi:hypothetical protein